MKLGERTGKKSITGVQIRSEGNENNEFMLMEGIRRNE
jgi:hypothetical protein